MLFESFGPKSEPQTLCLQWFPSADFAPSKSGVSFGITPLSDVAKSALENRYRHNVCGSLFGSNDQKVDRKQWEFLGF